MGLTKKAKQIGKKTNGHEDFIRVGRVSMRNVPLNVCNFTCFNKPVSVFNCLRLS